VGVVQLGTRMPHPPDPPPRPSPTIRAFTPVFDGLWGEGEDPHMTLRADHIAGGVAIAAALAVLSVSGDLPFGTLAFPGAGMMPKLVCALMIGLGAILIARGGASTPFRDISWSELPHALRVLVITAAAVALYTTLGFIVTMSLMLFALIAFEGRNLIAAAAYSVSVSLLTYALFTIVLKSPLEQGILPF
jgi:putative tricarboxylic transport membrane protein